MNETKDIHCLRQTGKRRCLGLLLSCMLMLTSCVGSATETVISPEVQIPDISSVLQSDDHDAVSQASEEFVRGEKEIRFAIWKGAASLGTTSLLDDNMNDKTANPYGVTLWDDDEDVVDLLLRGEADLGILSSIEAATLYNQGGDITVLAVNTVGGIQLLSKGEEISSVAELRGKTIWVNNQCRVYEMIVNKILWDVGLEAGIDVELVYLPPDEVTALMIENESGICVLSVPYSSTLLVEQPSVTKVVNIGEVWTGSLPMGCVVVWNDFLEEHEKEVKDFLTDYSISTARMITSSESYLQQMVDTGLVASYDVAAQAVEDANISFVVGGEMQSILQSYYLLLFQGNDNALKGGLPYDDFYYGIYE